MHNKIAIACPRCDKELIFKTITGTCENKRFNIESVSWLEFMGIIDKLQPCFNCGTLVKVFDYRKQKRDYSYWTNGETAGDNR